MWFLSLKMVREYHWIHLCQEKKIKYFIGVVNGAYQGRWNGLFGAVWVRPHLGERI